MSNYQNSWQKLLKKQNAEISAEEYGFQNGLEGKDLDLFLQYAQMEILEPGVVDRNGVAPKIKAVVKGYVHMQLNKRLPQRHS